MTLSTQIVWNTIAQVLGKSFSTVLGVVITILLTRYLGPAGYGTLTFVLVFVTMFGTLADWGLTLITIREAARNAKEAAEIVGNVLVIRLVLAFLAALVAVIAINFLPYSPDIRFLTGVGAVMLIALSIKTSFQIIFNVKLKMQNWAVSEIAANGLTLLLVLGIIFQKGSLLQVILAYLAGNTLAAIVAGFLAFRLIPLRFSLVKKSTRFLLLEALPMGSILVLFTVYNRIDTVILSLDKGNTAVGLYGAAYRIYEVLVLGAAYFANSILPLISLLAREDREKMKLIFRQAFVVLFLMGAGVAVVNFLFAPIWIAILAGPAFAGSVTALRILSLALIVSYFNHLNGYTLIALGRQWYSFYIGIVALVINVALNMIFIPIFSYNAAAFITFLTEGIVVLLSLVLIRRILGVRPKLGDVFPVTRDLILKKGQIFNVA